MQKRELAAALVDVRVELKVQLFWSRDATHWEQADMAQAKSGFALAHAARVELVLARQRGAVALDGGRGSCGGHGGGHGCGHGHGGGRGHTTVLLPVRRGLASGFKGAKRIKHTRRVADDSCKDQLGDSNGGGGGDGDGGGEAVGLVKEGIRVEASLRCARSEDGTMVLPLLPLLPPLLPPLLLRAVVFPGPLGTAVAGGAAPPAPSARPGRAPLLSHAW